MLSKSQIKCIELMITSDKSNSKIAQEIGVHRNTISNWLKNEEFLNEKSKFIKTQLQSSAGKALRTMVKLLNAKNEQVRYNAAKDILDRTGHKPSDKIEHSGNMGVNIIDDIK